MRDYIGTLMVSRQFSFKRNILCSREFKGTTLKFLFHIFSGIKYKARLRTNNNIRIFCMISFFFFFYKLHSWTCIHVHKSNKLVSKCASPGVIFTFKNKWLHNNKYFFLHSNSGVHTRVVSCSNISPPPTHGLFRIFLYWFWQWFLFIMFLWTTFQLV